MAVYIEKRTIELTKTPGRTGQVKAITLRRGENDATEIQGIVKNNGAIFNPNGYTIKFKALLPNGDFAEIPGTVSNATQGIISATVTNALTAVDGNITVAYFELSKGATILTTDAIPIWVERDMDMASGDAASYQNHIDNLVKQLDKYMTDASKAASAANAANSAAASANSAASMANKIKDDLQSKLDSGYFKGEKGDKGDQGIPGAQNLNKGMFALAVEGDILYRYSYDNEAPEFQLDSAGMLYMLFEN